MTPAQRLKHRLLHGYARMTVSPTPPDRSPRTFRVDGYLTIQPLAYGTTVQGVLRLIDYISPADLPRWVYYTGPLLEEDGRLVHVEDRPVRTRVSEDGRSVIAGLTRR